MVHPLSFATLWPYVFGTLASLLLLSGIDDLVPVAACLVAWLKTRAQPPKKAKIHSISERRMAIFVPCWRESGVIGSMIRHNIARIRYHKYEFFLGVYPNDPETLQVARQLSAAFSRVHVAVCPRPGPTSKADCLNSVFRAMCEREQSIGVRFDTIVLHDAEDVIHADALGTINRERARYSMIQVPVLPLPTPVSDFTHGIYCDDFAEFQVVDMRARQIFGSFIPSNGVGTGFAREILEELAAERGGAVFDPASLTEDYEIGVWAHKHGYRQVFLPVHASGDAVQATREYFPKRVQSAIRQRTRWVTGICLQSWARDRWAGDWRTKYWFWRDRKALIANPLSLLTNVLFVIGAATWVQSSIDHRPWIFALSNPLLRDICAANLLLQTLRLALRSACTYRIYGLIFALAVPLRVMHGNFINCCASVRAVRQFADARKHKRTIPWAKTDHAYIDSATGAGKSLADVLVGGAYLTAAQVTAIKNELASDAYLAKVLAERGLVPEERIYSAVSMQSGIPFTCVDPATVRRSVLRTLPRRVREALRLIPFGVESGRLFVAATETPQPDVRTELKKFTQLPIEFFLVTKANFDSLVASDL